MPTAAPVTASLIVKNEPLLRDTLTKLRPYVQEIVVVDTGSEFPPSDLAKEGLIDRLEIRPGEFDYYGVPIDFAAARNRSLGLATQPWMLWLDGDDTIEGLDSLHELIADAESHRLAGPPNRQVQVMLPYEYSHDGGGRCDLLIFRERLHSKPGAWVWQYPVHEILAPAPGIEQYRLDRTCMIWKHRRDQAGKTGEGTVKRNVAIIQKYLEHTPEDQIDYRMAFYAAISFAQAGLPDEAEKWFEKSMSLSNMDFDKVMTMTQLSKMLEATGKLDKALSAASFVMQTQENWCSGYFQIAKIWYAKAQQEPKDLRRWERVVHFAKLGLALPDIYDRIWFVDPRERREIQIYLCVAYDNLSRYAEGLAAAEDGLKGFPGDAALEFNRDLFASVVGQARSGRPASESDRRCDRAGAAAQGLGAESRIGRRTGADARGRQASDHDRLRGWLGDLEPRRADEGQGLRGRLGDRRDRDESAAGGAGS
jgi:tetratricopeptide (TPR) repeat protein